MRHRVSPLGLRAKPDGRSCSGPSPAFEKAAGLYFKAAQEQPAAPRLWYQAGLSLHSQSK